jgi:hypothetical protein
LYDATEKGYVVFRDQEDFCGGGLHDYVKLRDFVVNCFGVDAIFEVELLLDYASKQSTTTKCIPFLQSFENLFFHSVLLYRVATGPFFLLFGELNSVVDFF